MNHRISIVLATLLLIASGLTGCAYHAGAGDRQVPGGYRLVSVPVFKNQTPEVGVEVYFTNAIVRELSRSRLAKVTDKSSSEVTLEGAITAIKYLPGNPALIERKQGLAGDAQLNQEYRIVAEASLKLRRNSDQRVLWEGSFSGERSYLTPKITLENLSSADALYNQSARYQNIQVMAQDIMSEAFDRLTENF